MVSAARSWAANDMPRTLRQLWADEDEVVDRELASKRRASRLRAKQEGRARRSVVIHGKAQ
jgi:hypothetical protein